jgi:hypothetical protein
VNFRPHLRFITQTNVNLYFSHSYHKLQKVKLSLYLINYEPRHDDLWVSGGIASPFLISALDGGQWSVSRPGRFTRVETTAPTSMV